MSEYAGSREPPPRSNPMAVDELPAYFLNVRDSVRLGPVWEVRWRHTAIDGTRSAPRRRPLKLEDGTPCQAWMQLAGEQWVPRKGKPRPGHFTEQTATVAAAAFVDRVERELVAQEAAGKPTSTRATFRDAWTGYRAFLEQEGVTPNTLYTYDCDFAEPGAKHKRGSGTSPGHALKALGDRPLRRITTEEIDRLLDDVAAIPTGRKDADGKPIPKSARTVNRLRQGLHAIFEWACIPRNGFGIRHNPVTHARVRKERKDHSRVWWFSYEEVEAVARALEQGLHRATRTYKEEPVTFKDEEAAARSADDQRDADAVRLTFLTGLRLNELTAMKIRQVRIAESKLMVNRSVSHGVEQERDKADDPGEVPLPDPAIVVLDRVLEREHFTEPDDFLFCGRDGSILSGSALTKRFKKALKASGLPHPDRTWHHLRHSYGTELVRGGVDLVTVKDAMRHSKLATTERYLHARDASKTAKEFTAVFHKASGALPAPAADPTKAAQPG